MQKISLIANFRIDNAERLARLVDSYKSLPLSCFNDGAILIRGILADQACKKLQDLGCDWSIRCEADSTKCWASETNKLAQKTHCDYIFTWVEDHIFLSNIEYFQRCLIELKIHKIDQLYYSFLTDSVTRSYYNSCDVVQGNNLVFFSVSNKTSNKFIYTSSLVTIVSRPFFNKIIDNLKKGVHRWPHETPFNYERLGKDNVQAIVRIAFPKQELFASIDDDKDKGYSLISRGLYEDRVTRDRLRSVEFNYGYLSVFKSKFSRIPWMIKLYSSYKSVKYTIRYRIQKLLGLINE